MLGHSDRVAIQSQVNAKSSLGKAKAPFSPVGQADVGDIGGVEGFGGVAFFGVEDDDVFDDAALFQDDVHVLRAHAGFGQQGEPATPFFVQANGDDLSLRAIW
jgi:hypothetical protein